MPSIQHPKDENQKICDPTAVFGIQWLQYTLSLPSKLFQNHHTQSNFECQQNKHVKCGFPDEGPCNMQISPSQPFPEKTF